MVDSGPFPPESVIELEQRRGSASRQPEPARSWGESLLAMPFLLERLSAPAEQVRMWAAYHLVDRWQADCGQFIDALWGQSAEEIKDSAINLIGKYRIQHYAFPLLRVFREDEGTLRPLAGAALGRLQYEPAARLLRRWFDEAFANPETSPVELEAAAESLLLYDNAAHWPEIHACLASALRNHTFYSILFGLLAAHARTPEQVEALAASYGAGREVFHDFHLTQHLEAAAGRPQLSRYVQARLNRGYAPGAIYREALGLLDPPGTTPDEHTRGLLARMDECAATRQGLQAFIDHADALLAHLAPEGSAHARACLRGCAQWLGAWENGILKLRDLEAPLIFSAPLAALLGQAERTCLADPSGEALRITRIYQSPLLSPRFMADVLHLVGNRRGGATAAVEPAPNNGWVRDEEKDALWKLFTGQLDGVDYPFEQVLPQPWQYAVPTLLERLAEVLEARFDAYLAAGRRQAVDYCLEVFRRAGALGPVPALVAHFEALVNHHYHAFVELMTHLPDARFLPPLIAHYQEGEADLLQLIHFICDVHRLAHPPVSRQTAQDDSGGAPWSSVRLACPACGGAYQYPLESLYVNEERIEQRQLPSVRDLWTPTAYTCKKCGGAVAFEPDEHFLNELFMELLAARMTRPDDEGADRLRHVRLIQFPTLEGRTYNPAEFLDAVERALAAGLSPEREAELLLEAGRFRLELGQRAEAKHIFQRLLAGQAKCPHASYYLGIIAFQERNLYEARVHFSRVVQANSREDFENELDNPVDMAHHYLKLLDKREFKRSHFHLVSS